MLVVIRILLSTSILFSFQMASADAELLSNEEVYAKCYAKITDHPVEMNSADYLKVKAGTLTPVKACMNILSKAMFVKKGSDRVLPSTTDTLSQAILRNFHQFHLSWFTSNRNPGTINGGEASFVDLTQPALYVTDALFDKKHFRTITTSNQTVQGLRDSGTPALFHVNGTDRSNVSYYSGPLNADTTMSPVDRIFVLPQASRVQIGTLIGIGPAKPVEVPFPFALTAPNPLPANLVDTTRTVDKTADLNRHFGGGILGTPAAFYNNDEVRGRLDGGARVHRRWAANMFYDLMCSRLPNLKDTDAPVVAEFEKYKSSNLGFRTNKTCLSCHTTIDNFAHVAKNVTSTTTNNTFRSELNEFDKVKNYGSLTTYYHIDPTHGALPAVDSDPRYVRRSPASNLIYRNYNGTLINRSVADLADLGAKVAAEEDIYVCAAKRYYYFLTGVDVGLTPIAMDPVTKKAVSESEQFSLYHRSRVVALGKRLQTHGSLSRMIEEILNSHAFKARNPATVGED